MQIVVPEIIYLVPSRVIIVVRELLSENVSNTSLIIINAKLQVLWWEKNLQLVSQGIKLRRS